MQNRKKTKTSLLTLSIIFSLMLTVAVGRADNPTTVVSSIPSEAPLIKDVRGVDAVQAIQKSEDFFLDLVTVGDPLNAPDKGGLGAVSATYQIGKYEVTARQYAAFLNAVAWKEDPHGLYHTEMGTDKKVACIERLTNADGTYRYNLIDEERGNLPITYVSLNDAERFCNWLENGSPGRDQGYKKVQQSTEFGAYTFLEKENQVIVETNLNAHFHIPSEDEWVKTAYYKGHGCNAGYALYPTGHDTAPSNGLGEVSNFANYQTYQGALRSNFLDEELMITTVDCFDQTATFYQAHDMGGNVAEWTSSTSPSGLALVRGGSWQSVYSWYGVNDLMRTAPSKSYDASVATNFIGFRIAVTVDVDLDSAQNDSGNSQDISSLQADEQSTASALQKKSSNAAFYGKMFVTGGVLLGSSLLFIAGEIAIGVLWPEAAVAVVAVEAAAEAGVPLAAGEVSTLEMLGTKFFKTLETFPPRRIFIMGLHLLINAYAITKAQE